MQKDDEICQYLNVEVNSNAISKIEDERTILPNRFEKVYTDKKGNVFVKLEGHPQRIKLYDSTDLKKSSRILRIFCIEKKRDMKQEAIERSLNIEAPLKKGGGLCLKNC